MSRQNASSSAVDILKACSQSMWTITTNTGHTGHWTNSLRSPWILPHRSVIPSRRSCVVATPSSVSSMNIAWSRGVDEVLGTHRVPGAPLLGRPSHQGVPQRSGGLIRPSPQSCPVARVRIRGDVVSMCMSEGVRFNDLAPQDMVSFLSEARRHREVDPGDSALRPEFART